ncbi:MAG: heme biosynthesis HemY N-terminal domain-containing protein, partial [Conchiformibius sp.]|nr:heme biosynthesis HemY N-terminal domain-containing protein [Conchiformibius sp.]
MRGLIWIIMLFAAAVGVAIAAHHYSGNVYVQIDQTLVRMNLHLFIVGLLVSVCTLYFLVKLLFGVLATPGKIGRFGSSRKYRKAVDALNQAGVAYFEGRYPKAAHEAAKVLSNKHAGDNRVLALLIAAECARQNGES